MNANQIANVIGTGGGPFHDGSVDPMLTMGGGGLQPGRTTSPYEIQHHASKFGYTYAGVGENSGGNALSNDMQNMAFSSISMKNPVTYNLQGIKDRLKERWVIVTLANSRDSVYQHF